MTKTIEVERKRFVLLNLIFFEKLFEKHDKNVVNLV